MPRILKQLVFGSGFLVVFGFIAFGAYYLWQAEATCSDQIKNQGEDAVDCGGPCIKRCPFTPIPRTINKKVLQYILIVILLTTIIVLLILLWRRKRKQKKIIEGLRKGAEEANYI